MGSEQDMAEPTPCRWGAMSILMRLKKQVKDKFFWYRFLNDPFSPDAQETDAIEWMDSQLCDNETSTSNHHDFQHYNEASTPNHIEFQQPYFDAPQLFQDTSLPQLSTLGQSEADLFPQMLHDDEMMVDSLEGCGTSHVQEDSFTEADFGMNLAHSTSQPIYAQYGRAEYIDARAEVQDEQSSLQHGYSAPPQLGNHTSTVEKMEVMDTGDSSNVVPAQQSSAAEWQHLIFLRQFLGVGPGWRVVFGRIRCRIASVAAFRGISGLIRGRRQQRTPQVETAPTTSRRIKSGDVTKYKGIRPRNGKWVSEIRIGGTLEKVWLGSYNTEKEAALAFDAGKHHCSLKKAKGFNFADSPRLLGAPQSFSHLSAPERRTMIQRLAEDHARAYGSADIR